MIHFLQSITSALANQFMELEKMYSDKRHINGVMGFERLCLLGNCIGQLIPVCISDVYWAIYFSHISVSSYGKWCFQLSEFPFSIFSF